MTQAQVDSSSTFLKVPEPNNPSASDSKPLVYYHPNDELSLASLDG